MEPATLPVQEALTRQSRRWARQTRAGAAQRDFAVAAGGQNATRQLAGKSERTQESYLRAVRKFAQFTGRAPDVTTEDDLRRYFLFIKNEQLWEANSLKLAGSKQVRTMTVSAQEFIRRYLQHVLPRGFQKVRHYGFAHPRRKLDRQWLVMLVTITLNMVYTLTRWRSPARDEQVCVRLSQLRRRTEVRRLHPRHMLDRHRQRTT